jgi:hypothetical protein
MTDLKLLPCPHGPIEIRTVFGDIEKYISSSSDGKMMLDSAFEHKHIVSLTLPFPLRLASEPKKMVSTIRCHALLTDRISAIFEDLGKSRPLAQKLYWGGCFNFRLKRNGLGLSTHSWGIAIDLNPETNKRGTMGDMPLEIVAAFKNYGFIWGGNWNGKARDPMHFQYCTGY